MAEVQFLNTEQFVRQGVTRGPTDGSMAIVLGAPGQSVIVPCTVGKEFQLLLLLHVIV